MELYRRITDGNFHRKIIVVIHPIPNFEVTLKIENPSITPKIIIFPNFRFFFNF